MILDYLDKLDFASNDEDYIFDAKMTLARLSQGLFWLHNLVAQAEARIRTRALPDDVVLGVVNGVLENEPADWLSCAFQWYAVSAYNYARLVAWLCMKDSDFTNSYLRRVMPRITEYRHKVAAHFALTAPRNDNEADLKASIFTNVVFAHGYLRAGAMSETLTDATGNEIEARNKTSWSLTKSHSSLLKRYWPNGPLETSQAIRLAAGATRKFKIDWSDE